MNTQKFKLGILGTHGIGKTTLAYDLAQILQKKSYSVSVLTELARECPYELGVNQVKEATIWLITRQIARELELLKNSDILLCDRTSLDALIYTLTNGTDRKKDMNISRLSYDWLDTYDLIIWIRPNNHLVDDGFRMLDLEYRKSVDLTFKKELKTIKRKNHIIEISQSTIMNPKKRQIFVNVLLKSIINKIKDKKHTLV